MYEVHFKNKFTTISAIVALVSSLSFSVSATAGSVTYADPVPAGASYPGCLPDLNGTPTGNDGGISYDWTVTMGKKDSVSFVNRVGAKSFNEPPPFYSPPETGWTHTSNWVALNLTHKTKLRIEVARQEGVPFTNAGSIATARNKLIPGIALYSGWDNTSCEDHRYNTSGNFAWSTLQYIGNQTNNLGKPVAVYSIILNAGRYSIAIGGTPSVLATYPAATCDATTDPVCYAYTGQHGYRAVMTTE